jgi:hypothetical protein
MSKKSKHDEKGKDMEARDMEGRTKKKGRGKKGGKRFAFGRKG